jgi:hypothetical protein
VEFDEARLRGQLEKFNRAFTDRAVDDYLADLDPEIDFGSVTLLAEARTVRGHAEVRAYLEALHDAFDDIAVRADSFEEIAEGILLTLGRWRARGRSSGVDVDTEWAVASHLTPDYHVLWARAFTNEAAARAAALDRAREVAG